jgi:hypothetical protein
MAINSSIGSINLPKQYAHVHMVYKQACTVLMNSQEELQYFFLKYLVKQEIMVG